MRNSPAFLLIFVSACTLYTGDDQPDIPDSAVATDAGQSDGSVPADTLSFDAGLPVCFNVCEHLADNSWTCSPSGDCVCDTGGTKCIGLCDEMCSPQDGTPYNGWHCDSYGMCECNDGVGVCREAS